MNIRNVLIGLIASAVLTGIVVSCGGGSGDSATPTYTVGGTVSGMSGTVVLQLNGAGNLTIPASGSFTFAGSLANGSTYAVTVLTQPVGQTCGVTNGTGTLPGANVTNVSVTCPTNVVIRSTTLTGALQNPPVTTAATGRGAVVVNQTTKEITGGFTFTGLTPTTGNYHIHQAPSGNPTGDGGVIINLVLNSDTATSGSATVPAGRILTDPEYAALLAGELYFNIHTVANPGGEIRGQITGTTGVIAGLATLNGLQEGNTSTATGRGTIVLDSTTRVILISYVTHNVSGANAAHIHTGAPGASGPADVVTLTAGTSVYTAPHPTTLIPQNVTDLNAGNTYFNVHSNNCPTCAAGGEIRGQIVVQ